MVGIDEVGRGAWAGPLLVVAVRKKIAKKLPTGLSDSKQLTRRKREILFSHIEASCDIGEGWVAAEVIDECGLTAALRSACMLAVHRLKVRPSERIILDGSYNFLQGTRYGNVHTIIKADHKEQLVSAASVYAKVLRDRVMAEYAQSYSQYGFDTNVGYGTKAHQEALTKYGPTFLHRKSFKPLKELLDR